MSDTATQAEQATTPRKVRNITFVDTPPEVPPILGTSIYPWDKLAEYRPFEKSFFVECESKDDADTLRQSVYASGRVYYQKRKIERRPVVRVMEFGDPKQFGVMAWCNLDEGEDEETVENQ